MIVRKLLFAAVMAVPGVLATHLLDPSVAHADNTTGAIQGVVSDAKTGENLAGVTVIATSPALGQAQTAITDDRGAYKISDLPPGDYLVTFYYADITVAHSGVHVGIDKTTPVFQKLNSDSAGGEVVHVHDTAPTIDPTSTTQGITLDKNYLKNIPVPGRTFDAALGAAAGSQADAMGVSFSGSSSLENQYYVDGVNTTGLTLGTVGSPVVNDFIEEIEIITGGYNAEYGRATGGIVNVVTKSGSNEFKGSIFGYWQPGQLTAAAKTTPVNAASIDITPNTAYIADIGFEIGGPIVKDKLWFFFGFDPSFAQTDFTRSTKSETDCRTVANAAAGIPQGPIAGLSACDKKYADAVPDVDPKTGFYITDPIDQEIRSQTGHTYNAIGKINYAATPEHQGQISVQALPSANRVPIEAFGLAGPLGNGITQSDLTTDVSAKWTSKFNDNKTEIEAIVGWHRDYLSSDALDPTMENQPQQVLVDGDLSHWGPGFGESAKTIAGCTDNPNPNSSDKYPLITNCPMQAAGRSYAIGGPGFLTRDTEDRKTAKLSIVHRLKAAGSHEIKAGIDFENNTADKARLITGDAASNGGVAITNYVNDGEVITDRYVQIAPTQPLLPNGMADPRYAETCHTPNPNPTSSVGAGNLKFYCAYLGGSPGDPGTQVTTNTFNWGAYVRDSWQIQPNITLNAGLRYEEQYLRYATFLQHTTDVLTGDPLGTNAMVLNGNWAPRIGILWDPTKEGRSKIYAHWGRFYESIPMDINNRSFGGEVDYNQQFSAKNCGQIDPKIGGPNGLGCTGNGTPYGPSNPNAVGDLKEQLIGASGELVEPGIKSQYMDEIIAGMEYELLDDLKLGISYQNRSLGRIVEDVSTDGANTYIIANPGEFSSAEQASLQAVIDRTDDPTQKAHLQHELGLYEGIRIFDHATRDYNALQFTLTRRFSKALYVQASYTYSRSEGNYPGLISANNGQVDPNISSQFDLIELLSNHVGPLPTDRPHYIKIDGYYQFDFKKYGDLTVGVRMRALSGTPEDALAAHYLYGPNESFLLPRGSLGRTDFDHGLDVHIGYGKKLNKNMKLELFFNIFNIYDRQGTAAVDTTYAPPNRLSSAGMPGELENANPVSGGTYQDLIWVKTINAMGVESAEPIGRNPNFLNTTARYLPANGQIGARLTF